MLITSSIYYFVPITVLYTSYALPNVVLKNIGRYHYLPHFINEKLSFWQILSTTEAIKLFTSHLSARQNLQSPLSPYSLHICQSPGHPDSYSDPHSISKCPWMARTPPSCELNGRLLVLSMTNVSPHTAFPTYAIELSLLLSICIPFLSSRFSSSFWGTI